MYKQQNQQHKGGPSTSSSPRISFSSTEFLNSSQITTAYTDAPVSSDFEFSINHSSMITSADELVSKGRFLPFKGKTTTLRDELQNIDEEEEEEEELSSKTTNNNNNNPSRLMRSFLGLTKSRIGSKNSVKAQGSSSSS